MALIAIKMQTGRFFDLHRLMDGQRDEVSDFIRALYASDPSEVSKLTALFDWVCDRGLLRNASKFALIERGIHAFKSAGCLKIACFISGSKSIILTNGFTSRTNYADELERAVSLKSRYCDDTPATLLATRDETTI